MTNMSSYQNSAKSYRQYSATPEIPTGERSSQSMSLSLGRFQKKNNKIVTPRKVSYFLYNK